MANMEGMATAKRERSPLKYPAAANLGLSPSLSSYTHSGVQSNHTADTNINTTFAAQASLSSFQEPSFAQDLGQAQQPFGITSDPAYDAFQSSAQHFTLDSTYPAGLNSTESTFSNSSILDPHISPHSLSNGASPDPISFPSYELNPDGIDPSLMNEILQEQGNPMATMGSSATPPHLLPGMMRNSVSPSPQASPNVQQSPFGAMSRPRNTSESLDPSSAFGHGSEWGHMGNFRGHRRGNSDALSEISSHSAQASPYMGTLDHSSPMLNPAADASFNDSLNIEGFTINDHPSSRPQSYHSPAHSPQPSPRLMPQQPLPPFTAENNYGLNDASIQPQFTQSNGYDLFNPEPFPTLPQGLSPSSNEMGQADHMSPPAINIDYAEPTRQIDAPTPGANGDLIIPPRRTRAKSDPYADHRPTSPGFRGRSPSLQPGFIPDNLSPFPSQPASRSTSPRGRNGSINGHVRSVSAASDQREYILDLANPERSPSNGGDSKRSQKHPATFQCHLCPKRFTRAYNLRSHLRTHTDERPFVCTVCKKAFARQHDRKRHEGLHSGEKKFVCRGPLKSGGQWGCSRRFARADALGRHFRSEAGRVCIKPLLDEEAAEQEQAWRFEQQQAQVAYPMFPQALLAQYPALAGIDWNSTPTNPQEEEYHNGRSSFDASSGGEMYDEASENEMGNPYQNQNIGMMAPAMNQGFGMGMQQQTQMHGYGNHQMADFTNGMEGR